MKYWTLALASIALVLSSCNSDDDGGGGGTAGSPGGDTGGDDTGGGDTGAPLTGALGLGDLDLGPNGDAVVSLNGTNISPIVTDVFDRYTALEASSGDRIHLFAEPNVTDAQLTRAREILRLQLIDIPGSVVGEDKSDVIDAIAQGNGTLALFGSESGFDTGAEPLATFDEDFGSAYVPLFANAVVVEGSDEYIAASPAIDETFGAAAVLTYRMGLVNQRPDWTMRFMDDRANAELSGAFNGTDSFPYQDLDEAYLAVLAETHSDTWAHDPNGDGAAQGGVYAFGSRSAMLAGDSPTFSLFQEAFTDDYSSYEAQVDPGFGDTFDQLFRTSTPYTYRSRHLRNVRLNGELGGEIFGSTSNDLIFGNDANNTMRGRSGDDIIDGGGGFDTAAFLRPQAQFDVTIENGVATVVDTTGELGTDICINCEQILFTDGDIDL